MYHIARVIVFDADGGRSLVCILTRSSSGRNLVEGTGDAIWLVYFLL